MFTTGRGFDSGLDDRQACVRMAFESLDAKDRLILTLFCIDQLRHVEIAEIWVTRFWCWLGVLFGSLDLVDWK